MKLPSYADRLGVTSEDAPGGPVLLLPFAERLTGRPDFLHGGAIAELLEVAGLAALEDALASPSTVVVPITITIDYMRGGRALATRAAGRVVRLGTRVANVVATAWQDDPDCPIAAARLNYRIERP